VILRIAGSFISQVGGGHTEVRWVHNTSDKRVLFRSGVQGVVVANNVMNGGYGLS
jgi:hypothetical protein